MHRTSQIIYRGSHSIAHHRTRPLTTFIVIIVIIIITTIVILIIIGGRYPLGQIPMPDLPPADSSDPPDFAGSSTRVSTRTCVKIHRA
eukprot:2210062-Rhodomonas_salina.3